MTASSSAPPFGLFERSLALRYLRAKRQQGGVALISIISFLGIMLAVMALIVTMSIMNGFRETLLERLLGVGGHVYVDVRGYSAAELNHIIGRAERVTGVTQVAPVIEGQALATGDGFSSGVIVRGMRAQDLEAMTTVTSGLSFGGGLEGFDDPDTPRVLLGSRLASAVGAFQGDFVTLLSPNGAATPFGVVPRKKTFLVGGTFSTGAADYDSALIFMPLAQAQLFFGKGDGADQLDVRIANPSDPLPVKRGLREALGNEVYISDWKDRNSALVTALIVERNMMRIVLMILVAITTMNIITGLVMLVKNKSRDIAILRTMGATQGAILRVFFLSGASIGVLGTIAGIILGVLFCVFIGPIQEGVEFVFQTRIFDPEVYQLSRLPARLDFGEVAQVTVWALFMSFIATLPPSLHASKLDPVEALRYE